MEENKKETKTVENKAENKVTDKKVVATEEKKVDNKKEEAKKEDVKKENKKTEASKVTNKKFDTAKESKKQSNNMIAIGVVVAVAVVAILACIFLMKDSPRKVVESTLKDLKSGNYSKEMLSNISEENSFSEDAQKLLFEKLEWKVLNQKEEGETATVEVEITNKDFKTIIGNYMQKALKAAKAAISGQTISQEEMTNYLIEELKNDEIQTVTSTQSIVLQKQDGKWEISEEDNFVNSVLPGLNEAVNAFN